jgi:hypothetical protein
MSTRLPLLAKAFPKQAVVVVLPTPPLWFAMLMIFVMNVKMIVGNELYVCANIVQKNRIGKHM